MDAKWKKAGKEGREGGRNREEKNIQKVDTHFSKQIPSVSLLILIREAQTCAIQNSSHGLSFTWYRDNEWFPMIQSLNPRCTISHCSDLKCHQDSMAFLGIQAQLRQLVSVSLEVVYNDVLHNHSR